MSSCSCCTHYRNGYSCIDALDLFPFFICLNIFCNLQISDQYYHLIRLNKEFIKNKNFKRGPARRQGPTLEQASPTIVKAAGSLRQAAGGPGAKAGKGKGKDAQLDPPTTIQQKTQTAASSKQPSKGGAGSGDDDDDDDDKGKRQPKRKDVVDEPEPSKKSKKKKADDDAVEDPFDEDVVKDQFWKRLDLPVLNLKSPRTMWAVKRLDIDRVNWFAEPKVFDESYLTAAHVVVDDIHQPAAQGPVGRDGTT